MNYLIQVENRTDVHVRKEQVIAFLKSNGYYLEKISDSKIAFRKGSKWLNMIAINPLSWYSNIQVEILPDETICKVDVDSSFQMISSNERETWNAFINALSQVVEKNKQVEIDTSVQNTAKKVNVEMVLVAIISAVVIGIPTNFIVSKFDLGNIGDSVVPMWTLVGSMMVTIFWSNRNKKNAS